MNEDLEVTDLKPILKDIKFAIMWSQFIFGMGVLLIFIDDLIKMDGWIYHTIQIIKMDGWIYHTIQIIGIILLFFHNWLACYIMKKRKKDIQFIKQVFW